MTSEASFTPPPGIPPRDLHTTDGQDFKRAPEIPTPPSPFPSFPTAPPVSTHTVTVVAVAKTPSKLARLIAWISSLFSCCFVRSPPKLSFKGQKFTIPKTAIYLNLRKEGTERTIEGGTNISVYSPRGVKVGYAPTHGREVKDTLEEENQFYSELDGQIRSLAKDPTMPSEFRTAMDDLRYEESPPWLNNISHLHSAQEDAEQAEHINRSLFDQSLFGFKARLVKSPDLSSKDISIHVGKDKVESRCVRVYEIVDQFTNQTKGYVVTVSTKTVPLQLLYKPWDKVTPKQAALCSHTVEYAPLIKGQEAALRKFEKLTSERALARADRETIGLVSAVRAGMGKIFNKLNPHMLSKEEVQELSEDDYQKRFGEPKSGPEPISLGLSDFKKNLDRGIRCRVHDGDPPPYVQPKFPKTSDPTLAEAWGSQMKKDIHAKIVKHPDDEQWVDAILNFQDPNYFMKEMITDPQAEIQEAIKKHFADKFGEKEGEMESRKYLANFGGYPPIDFKIHRDPITGKITHVEYLVKDLTLDLRKKGTGIDRTTGMPEELVVVPGILKGTFSGVIRPDKEHGFAIDNIRRHHESPFLMKPLAERVSAPYESETTRKVGVVIHPMHTRTAAREAVPKRPITATPTQAPRISTSVQFPPTRPVGPSELVQPIPTETPYIPRFSAPPTETPAPPTSPARTPAPSSSSSSSSRAKASASPSSEEGPERMPEKLVKALSEYKANVEFRIPHVLRDQIAATPKEVYRGDMSRDVREKLIPIANRSGEKERELLVPEIVLKDVARDYHNNPYNSVRMHVRVKGSPEVSLVNSSVKKKKDTREDQEKDTSVKNEKDTREDQEKDTLVDFYNNVKRIIPRRTLGQLEPTPTTTPMWFNRLMFINTQGGWADEVDAINKEFLDKFGIAPVQTNFLGGQDDQLKRETIIEFDEETGNVTCRSTVIFDILIPPYSAEPRYIVRTVERTFPISALASGTFYPHDLRDSQYAIYSSPLFTSKEEAFNEIAKRKKADYQMPSDLVKKGKEAHDGKMSLQNEAQQIAAKAAEGKIKEINRNLSAFIEKQKKITQEKLKMASSSKKEHVDSFVNDIPRSPKPSISSRYHRDVTPSSAAPVERESAKLLACLKPDEVIPWKYLLESVAVDFYGLLTAHVVSAIDEAMIEKYHPNEPPIKAKAQPFPIEITIVRNPEPEGPIASIKFSIKEKINLLRTDSPLVVRDSFVESTLTGVVTLSAGVPQVHLTAGWSTSLGEVQENPLFPGMPRLSPEELAKKEKEFSADLYSFHFENEKAQEINAVLGRTDLKLKDIEDALTLLNQILARNPSYKFKDSAYKRIAEEAARAGLKPKAREIANLISDKETKENCLREIDNM